MTSSRALTLMRGHVAALRGLVASTTGETQERLRARLLEALDGLEAMT